MSTSSILTRTPFFLEPRAKGVHQSERTIPLLRRWPEISGLQLAKNEISTVYSGIFSSQILLVNLLF
jgi:hypothetical protein